MALLEVNWQPSSRELRQFAGIWFPAFCGVLGGLILYQTGSWFVPSLMWISAAVIGPVGVIFPGFIRPIFIGLMMAVYPVGWTVFHLLLALVYYLAITPVGLFLRVFGYDPMQRRFDRSAKSYWQAHNPGAEIARYFRQL